MIMAIFLVVSFRRWGRTDGLMFEVLHSLRWGPSSDNIRVGSKFWIQPTVDKTQNIGAEYTVVRSDYKNVRTNRNALV